MTPPTIQSFAFSLWLGLLLFPGAADSDEFSPFIRSAPQIVISHLAEAPDSGPEETWEERSGYREDSVADYLWEDWVPSHDGKWLMVWTAQFETDGFRIWDLERNRIISVQDRLVPEIQPVFGKDNQVVRYARKIPGVDDEAEVVTRNLESGGILVAGRIGTTFLDSSVMPFSPDGQIGIFKDREGAAFLLDWRKSPEGRIDPAFDGQDIHQINNEGTLAALQPELKVSGNDGSFRISIVSIPERKSIFQWTLDGGHTPKTTFAFPLDPEGPVYAAHHTSGSSLGYYAHGIAKSAKGKTEAEELDLDSEHALSIETISTPRWNHLVAVFATNGRLFTFLPGTEEIVHRYEAKDILKRIYAKASRCRLRKSIISTNAGKAFLPVIGCGIRVVNLQDNGAAVPTVDLYSLPGGGWFAVTADGFCDFSDGGDRYVFVRDSGKLRPYSAVETVIHSAERVREALKDPK